MHLTITMTAGQRLEFYERGDFFRLMAATAAVSVQYYSNGAEVAKADSVSAGYGERFVDGEFDRIAITSATAQTIQFATRLGNEIWYDTPPVGNVAITNIRGAFTNAQATVTNASTTAKAANASRSYLMIQNNDATGDIWVRLDGAAATTLTGVKIPAGGSYELTGYVPTGAITAIGSIASNANIVIVEG